ncbi:MAG: thioredoxin family protein [Thermoanaerobaculia bacterium]
MASLLAALLLAATAADASATWYKDVDEATRAAKAKKQLIFVDLFADWCRWCHEFDRVIAPSKVFRDATEDMVLLRVDTEDGGEGTALVRRYGVRRLPTFLILTPQETIAGKIEGFAAPEVFVRNLEEQLGAYEKFEEELSRQGSKTPQQRLGLARQLLGRTDAARADALLRKLIGSTKDASFAAEAYFLLAEAQRAQGKLDDAIVSVGEVLERLSRGDVAERAWLLRASVLVDQEKYAAALADFRKFKATYPDSALVGTVDYYLPRLEAYVAKSNGK